MTLSEELTAFRNEFITKIPSEIRQAMEQADAELAATNIIDRALKAGQYAPNFKLKNVTGEWIKLSDMLKHGPVVLSFYRGGWCPYCNLELRALQKILFEIKELGANLIALSPQTPDESLSTKEKDELTFPVLSDLGSKVALEFGIAFDLAKELRPIYSSFNHALPDINGDKSWRLPIPATYIIDQNGIVALAFLDVDYRNRLDPEEILKTLKSLNHSYQRDRQEI